MCRMVGSVFRHEPSVESLLDLREVSRTGLHPDGSTPGHSDGWGIVSFRNGSPLYVGRSCRPIYNDESFESALSDVVRLQPPNILLAHARALSIGVATIPNTHPFVMDDIAFCHNGTVENIDFKTKHQVKGETDSELLFARLLDRFDESGDMEDSIRKLVVEDIRPHTYTAAIMFITDGKNLYAYRDCSEGNSPDYYDLKMAVSDDCVTFYQETRGGYQGDLSQIENRELVSVSLDLDVRRENIR